MLIIWWLGELFVNSSCSYSHIYYFVFLGVAAMKTSICFFAIFFMTISLYSQTEPLDTDGNGYRNISSLEHLRWVSENESCWGDKFELDNDIDAKKTKKWNDGKGWSPIGTEAKPFTGIFDGKGHSITKLTVDRSEMDSTGYRYLYKDIAMFGHIKGKNAQIMNLSLLKCDIKGGQHTAGFAANVSGATITNCHSNCKMNGGAGFISISKSATITNCSSNCKILDGGTGFISIVESSTITHCHSNCKIRGSSVAGFIDKAESSTIQYCSAKTKILFKYDGVGFISDVKHSTISQCSSHGEILCIRTSSDEIFMFLPTATGFVSHSRYRSEISNCFSMCLLNCMYSVYRFSENNDSKITKCYSSSIRRFGYIIDNPLFDMDVICLSWLPIVEDMGTLNVSLYEDGKFKTATELQTKSTYTDAGWDFDTIWDINPKINHGYPYLRNVKID